MGERIGVGIIGFGFMGRTHAGAYAWASQHAGLPAELLTIADSRGEKSLEANGGNMEAGAAIVDTDRTRIVKDHRDLLDDPLVDLVSICTPTDTHVDLAIEALEAGKHVLVEKPVSVRIEDAERLADAARLSDRICMPAMCMRFWPGWRELAVSIEQEPLGPVLSASFLRVGSPPAWSGFYADESRSGGAVLDLHIHDVDFLLHCFGEPDSVVSVGTGSHISTQYRFAHGPAMVVAEGGWLRSPHKPFVMRHTVEFDRGVMEFDLSADPSSVVHDENGTRPIEIGAGTGYDHQACAIIEAILGGHASPVLLGDAVMGLRIIEAERRSASTGLPVRLRDVGTA